MRRNTGLPQPFREVRCDGTGDAGPQKPAHPAERGQPAHQREPGPRRRAAGGAGQRPVAHRRQLRGLRPAGRLRADRGLPVVGADRRGGPGDVGPGGRDAVLRTAHRYGGTPETAGHAGPRQVPGPSRPAAARGGRPLVAAAGGAGPPHGQARRPHLPRGEGGGRGVQPGGRGDPGHVRLPGGAGHRQRTAVPGRAAGQGRPGDARGHLSRGRGGLRREDGGAGLRQPWR